jgi:hypothetical protein
MININIIKKIINYLIKIIHLLLIIFVVGAPFYNKYYLSLCILLLGAIIYKLKIYGSCLLTKLEYKILGYEKEEVGFIYRLINPIFTNFVQIKESNWECIFDKLSIIWLIILIIIYILKYS